MSKNNLVLVAELFGTFLLTGAVLMGVSPFIALGIIVLLIGGISGAHVNPAVSAGMVQYKKINISTMGKYWLAQVAGALLAKLAYEYFKNDRFNLAINFVSFDFTLFIAEILGTAIFLAGITLAVQQKLEGLLLAVAVGGSLFLGAMFGGVLNPAVALGQTTTSFASIIGPIIGGILGVYLGLYLYPKATKK